jgi:hypothetical protein
MREKVFKRGIVRWNNSVANVFETSGADIMTLNVTFGSAEREVRDMEGRLVPRNGSGAVARAIQVSGMGAGGSPQIVGADESAGEGGDGFSAVHGAHLESPRGAGEGTSTLTGIIS